MNVEPCARIVSKSFGVTSNFPKLGPTYACERLTWWTANNNIKSFRRFSEGQLFCKIGRVCGSDVPRLFVPIIARMKVGTVRLGGIEIGLHGSADFTAGSKESERQPPATRKQIDYTRRFTA